MTLRGTIPAITSRQEGSVEYGLRVTKRWSMCSPQGSCVDPCQQRVLEESTTQSSPPVVGKTWWLLARTWLWWLFQVNKDYFLIPQTWHPPQFLAAPSRDQIFYIFWSDLSLSLIPSPLFFYVCVYNLCGLNKHNQCCVSTISKVFYCLSKISVMIQL